MRLELRRDCQEGYLKVGESRWGLDCRIVNKIVCSFEGGQKRGISKVLTQIHRNSGPGRLKAKINLLLKSSAWGVTPHHDLASQNLLIRSPCEVNFLQKPFFIHTGAQTESGSFTGQSLGLPEKLKIKRENSGKKGVIEISCTNSLQFLGDC